MEEQLTTGLCERQLAELVKHDEVEPGQIVGDAALRAATMLGLQSVDEIVDVEEAAARAVAGGARARAIARCDLPVPGGLGS